MRIRLIWLAELVQVPLLRPVRADFAKIHGLPAEVAPARKSIERALPLALDPHVQVVVTGRNAFQARCILGIRDAIVRRRE